MLSLILCPKLDNTRICQTFKTLVILLKLPLVLQSISVNQIIYTFFLIHILNYQSKTGRGHVEQRMLGDELDELTPIPKQIKKFWASSKNKENIQLLARKMALLNLDKVVLSGMVVNNEIVKAQRQEWLGYATDESLLSTWEEEADSRLLCHIDWSVEKGCERIIVSPMILILLC